MHDARIQMQDIHSHTVCKTPHHQDSEEQRRSPSVSAHVTRPSEVVFTNSEVSSCGFSQDRQRLWPYTSPDDSFIADLNLKGALADFVVCISRDISGEDPQSAVIGQTAVEYCHLLRDETHCIRRNGDGF